MLFPENSETAQTLLNGILEDQPFEMPL